MEDERDFNMGIYNMRAFAVVLDHCLNGMKAQSKYFEEPIMSHDLELTEHAKQKEVDLFFAQESARRANWRRTHHKSDTSDIA